MKQCPVCHGSGKVSIEDPNNNIRCDPPEYVECPKCKGRGFVEDKKED